MVAKVESLAVNTDGFRMFDTLKNDENYQREVVIQRGGKYVEGDAYMSTCESHTEASQRSKLTPYLRAFQLRRRISREPSRETLAEIGRTVL